MSDRIYSIPGYCKKILDLLEKDGHIAYVAGGAVRDLISGRVPHDYDIASSARPEEVIAIAEKNDIRTIIENGLKHGTVTLLSDGNPIEITTFRNDGTYSDSRHPDKVMFSDDIEEDVMRRDFTMNALYLGSDGKVNDLVGGVHDIEGGIVRAVGDPDRRFNEDALRIMRGLRFASQHDLRIDDGTSAAMVRCSHLLKNISAERIFREFTDMLCGRAASRIIRENTDVLAVILPEIKEIEGFDQQSAYHDLDVLEHTLAVLDNLPADADTGRRDVILSYAALLHDIGKPASVRLAGNMKLHEQLGMEIALRFAEELRFPNDLKKTVSELVLLHDRFVEPTREDVYRFMTEHDPEFIDILAVLQKADIEAHSSFGRDRINQFESIRAIRDELMAEKVPLKIKELAISGDDLMSIGFPKGPVIGQMLKEILEEMIKGNLDNKCEDIFTFVREKHHGTE